MAERSGAPSVALISSVLLALDVRARMREIRFLRLPFGGMCKVSSEKKLCASRFRPGDGGTSVMAG